MNQRLGLQTLRGVLAMVLVIGLGAGCLRPKNTAPKFDPRAERKAITILTNLASVEAGSRLSPELLQPTTNLFTVGPGDKIEVEIIGDAASRAVTTVGPDGKIYFYLLPGLDVWGMSLPEIKELLEKELKQYLNNPQVATQLRGIDSKRIWILGRVANAGVYPIGGPMNVIEALSLAGGPLVSSASGTTEELADLTHSFVVRNGRMLPINFEKLLRQGDMSQNIYLQPDDFLYLPSSLSKDIYVLGAVRMPKAVARQHSSLVAAIADSGGPAKNAYLTHVAIVRGSLAEPKIAVVDYGAIIQGRAPDVLLEPRDIVYVPLSPYRYLSKYADLIVTTFVRAVAINEGARAAVPNATPAGVNIGISVGQ